MLFKTAIRNSIKYRRRSLVVVICIAISTIAMQTMDGIGEGFKMSALRFMLNQQGMIVFEPAEAEPLEFAVHSISKYGDIKEKIKEIIPDARISGKIFSPAIVVKDSFSIETAVSAEDDISGTVVGEKTAKMLNSEVGDTVILFGSNRYGGLSVVPAKVESTSKNFRSIRQGKGIMLPINLARMLLGWGEEEVRLVQVNFDEFWRADEYTKELKAAFPGVKITSWRERLTNIEDLFKVSDFKMNIFAAIILILVAGIIMNTILTSVLERKNDIGTLRSIGASRIFVTKMILLEIIFVAIIGTLIGSGISYVIVSALSKSGIVIGEVGEVIDYMSGSIYPEIVPLKWSIHVVFAITWAIIWSLYPIVYIIRMKPVDALRKTL